MIHPIRILRTLRAKLGLLERMEIRPTDRVLEVGSGQNPNLRAHVLCDRFVADATERNERAARNEKLLSYPFHRWMITEEEGTLVFREKEREIWDPELSAWFRRLGERVPGFAAYFMNQLYELGNVASVVWEEVLPVTIRRADAREHDARDGPAPRFTRAGEDDPEVEAEVEEVRAVLAASDGPGWKARTASFLAALLRRRSDPGIELGGLLACPGCGGAVEPGDGVLEGGACGRTYFVLDGPSGPLPYLVIPAPLGSPPP